MRSTLASRCAHLLGLVIFALALMVPAATSAATPAPSPEPTVTPSAEATRTTLPPFGGDTAPRPVRTRQDKIISTIAPIAMVVVLIAGLYIYWLIRKGL
ncbi:MAG TPA: hypothetical protein VFV09_07505 [Actinomycetota bacterium]|jgi:hypothetical protein|nr:hypothetical protein [Actinomycetota bacterium]